MPVNKEWGSDKQVKQCSYLGSILTSDGRCNIKIKRTIGVAKKAFKDLANILTNRKVKQYKKKNIELLSMV